MTRSLRHFTEMLTIATELRRTVSVDESRAAVRTTCKCSGRCLLRAAGALFAAGAITIVCATADAQTTVINEDAQVASSDVVLGDHFGTSVAVSGDVMVVGASFDNELGSQAGAAYVFHRSGSDWIEAAKLLASNGMAFDKFGTAVATDEDFIIVGAPFNDTLASAAGAVYVFLWNGADWVQAQQLLASDGAGGDEFGQSVSISGDLLVVGAPKDGSGATADTGAAYVYRWNGSTWDEEDKLTAADGTGFEHFGSSVAARGQVIVIGAEQDNALAPDSGSAYIFRSNGAEWVQEQKLLPFPNGGIGGRFGNAASISGDTILIGARTMHDLGDLSGAAYVFRFNGALWEEEQRLLASDGEANDLFGFAVGIAGDVAVVTSTGDDDLGTNSGSAYQFRFNGAAWVEEQKLLPSDGASSSGFGTSAAICEGGDVVIGDQARNLAYVFGVEISGAEVDSDGDGISDEDEIALGTDPFSADTDGDGLDDGDEISIHGTDPFNPDTDGDGLTDGEEALGLGTDPLNPDTDGDGLSDGDEVLVHITDEHNPDTDNDGLSDGDEVLIHGTNPHHPDTDGDSLDDADEILHSTDPNNPDSDGDDLGDAEEIFTFATDPLNPDTDGDLIDDGLEVLLSQFGGCPDPLVEDSDGDGLIDGIEYLAGMDACDADTDGDGLPDGLEDAFGTDPLNNDSDGDGLLDGTEVDIANGTGCPDPTQIDSDGDSLTDGEEVDLGTDPCSNDTDGDGIPDNIDDTPTDPGVSADFIEDALRLLCDDLMALPLDAFNAPNNNARKGRRTALCNKLQSAANLIADGNLQQALDKITNDLLPKLDSQPSPGDWMVESAAKFTLHDDLELYALLIALELDDE